ncbi:MAG TPA: hypothetical protein VFF79_00210 [Conexibacter sp.]|nr:hypothetical protein [Conexibacter sp.]
MRSRSCRASTRSRTSERETREVQAWVAHQHARAGEALAQLPGLDALADELTAHLLADRPLAPCRAGERWLWRERDVAGHTRALRVSARLEDGPGERLIAAAAIPVDGDEAIDWFAPSPDGRLLALGVSSHGDEQPVLALVDLATGARVGPSIPHVGSVAWLPDGSGLYLARGRARSQEQGLKRLAFLTPGERPTWVDTPPLAADGNLLVRSPPTGAGWGWWRASCIRASCSCTTASSGRGSRRSPRLPTTSSAGRSWATRTTR